jgi:hypothetical protein
LKHQIGKINLNRSANRIGSEFEPDGVVCREAEIEIILTTRANCFIGPDVRYSDCHIWTQFHCLRTHIVVTLSDRNLRQKQD